MSCHDLIFRQNTIAFARMYISTFNVRSNYTNYGQHLGHQYGANLSDKTFIIRYRPIAALQLMLRYTDMNQGRDGDDGLNYGGDPTRVQSVDRPGDSAPFGQGEAFHLQELHGRASYQLAKTPCFIDAEVVYRKENDRTSIQALGGLRLFLGK